MKVQRQFSTGNTFPKRRSTSFICRSYISQPRTALVLNDSSVNIAIIRAIRRLASTLEKLSAASFPRLPHMQLEAFGSRAKWKP